jgi:eight-cysteine-cluster-containing protein
MPWRPVVLALALFACSPLVQPQSGTPGQGSTHTKQAEGDRSPAVPASSPNHDHFEGVAFRNACYDDRDCRASGCSQEVCSADRDVSTTCMEYPDRPTGASCGCVQGQCIWYRVGPAPAAEAPPPPAPAADAGVKLGPQAAAQAAAPDQGQPCPEGRCAPGLQCMSYFGIAGPRGGAITSCEIRCGGAHPCPRNQECVQIADGPGQVCRPSKGP